MAKVYKDFNAVTKAIDVNDAIYEAMITTEEVDRDGDIVRAAGVKAENYIKNPVVMWAHDYHEPPVARTIGIEIVPGVGIRTRFQFPKAGLSQKADEIHRLWADGFLNAVSIGFAPLEWQPIKGEDTDSFFPPRDFTSWELLEYSIVPVPANANALRLGYEGKRGRVLSAANEKRIRQAVEALTEVLSSLGEEIEQDAYKHVIPYADHGTADEGDDWSRPNLGDFTSDNWADLSDAERRRIAAHFTWSRNWPPEAFGDLVLPHHDPQTSGVGPANWRGVAAAAGRLDQADVPEGDKSAMRTHLAGHYRQFDKPVPWENAIATPPETQSNNDLDNGDANMLEGVLQTLIDKTYSIFGGKSNV